MRAENWSQIESRHFWVNWGGGGKLFFSTHFSVCSRTSRSNKWSLGNCLTVCFRHQGSRKRLLMLLVGYYSYSLNCFTFCLKKGKTRDKSEVAFDYYLGLIIRVCFFCLPIYAVWRQSIFSPAVEWHLATTPPPVNVWSLCWKLDEYFKSVQILSNLDFDPGSCKQLEGVMFMITWLCSSI